MKEKWIKLSEERVTAENFIVESDSIDKQLMKKLYNSIEKKCQITEEHLYKLTWYL